MKKFVPIIILIVIFFSVSCKNATEKLNRTIWGPFDDQDFKTAIGLIELYQTRYGKYPNSLDSLTFLGEWDSINKNRIEYIKNDSIYELNYKADSITIRYLQEKYPKEFWKGLGLYKSNLKTK